MATTKTSVRHTWGPVEVGQRKCAKCGCFKRRKGFSILYFLPSGKSAGIYSPDCTPEPKINTKAHGSKNPW